MNLIHPRNVKTRSLFIENGDDAFKIEPSHNALEFKFMRREQVTRYYTWPEMYPVVYEESTKQYKREDTQEAIDVDPEIFKLHSYDSLSTAKQRLMAQWKATDAGASVTDHSSLVGGTAQVTPHIISVVTVEFFPTEIARFTAPEHEGSFSRGFLNECLPTTVITGCMKAPRVETDALHALSITSDQLISNTIATDGIKAIGDQLDFADGSIVVTRLSRSPHHHIGGILPPHAPSGISMLKDTCVGRQRGILSAPIEWQTFHSKRPRIPGALIARSSGRESGLSYIPTNAYEMERALQNMPVPHMFTDKPFSSIIRHHSEWPEIRVVRSSFAVCSDGDHKFFAETSGNASIELYVNDVLSYSLYRDGDIPVVTQQPVSLESGKYHDLLIKSVHIGVLDAIHISYETNKNGRTCLTNADFKVQIPDVSFLPKPGGDEEDTRCFVSSVFHVLQDAPFSADADARERFYVSCSHDASGAFAIAVTTSSDKRSAIGKYLLQIDPRNEVRVQDLCMSSIFYYDAGGRLKWALPKPFAHALCHNIHVSQHDGGIIACILAAGSSCRSLAHALDVGGAVYSLSWKSADPSDKAGIVKYSSLGAVQWHVSIDANATVFSACDVTNTVVSACDASSNSCIVTDGTGELQDVVVSGTETQCARICFIRMDGNTGRLLKASLLEGPRGAVLVSGGCSAYPAGGFMACAIMLLTPPLEEDTCELRILDLEPQSFKIHASANKEDRVFVQALAMFDADTNAVWMSTITSVIPVCTSMHLYAPRHVDCIVDHVSGDVTSLFFANSDAQTVYVTDINGTRHSVDVDVDGGDGVAVGLVRFAKDGPLKWARCFGRSSILGRILAAGPAGCTLLLLAESLVLVGASGSVIAASALKGLTDGAGISLSEGREGSNAHLIVTNDGDTCQWLESPDIFGPGGLNTNTNTGVCGVRVPVGVTIINLSFTDNNRVRLVVDGDLIVTGNTTFAAANRSSALDIGSVGEGHLAPRPRKALELATRIASGFGSVLANCATVPINTVIRWDHVETTGIVSASTASVVHLDAEHRFTVSVSGAYAVCVKAWETRERDDFKWKLTRCDPTGKVYASTSLVGASSEIIALDVGDSFWIINNNDADVYMTSGTKLVVQLIGCGAQ